jgi:hypothetical protein
MRKNLKQTGFTGEVTYGVRYAGAAVEWEVTGEK